jgi:hypothetical protein
LRLDERSFVLELANEPVIMKRKASAMAGQP